MGSCAAPSAKGDDKFITTDYLQQCRRAKSRARAVAHSGNNQPDHTLSGLRAQGRHTALTFGVW
ncbi:hypothetical protein ZS11_004268 [Salmonella enterica subsp. enterica]|nr:hypothetical protein [Salmonella enterica subsp. enterica]